MPNEGTPDMPQMRNLARKVVPDRMLAAYRTLRHDALFPFEAELPHVARFLRADALALDVGANVGIYTRKMAKHARHVIAFEPHPDCVRHLQRSVPGNVTVLGCALSDHDGLATLSSPVNDGIEHHGLGRLSDQIGPTTAHTVALKTLDSLAADFPLGRISFIKIDVEGHELPVLRGALVTLRRYRPALMVEIVYGDPSAVIETFDLLDALGYEAFVLRGDLGPIDAQSLRLAQAADSAHYVNNVFFLPSNH